MKKDYYVKIEERTYVGPFGHLRHALHHADLLAEDNPVAEVVTRADFSRKSDVTILCPGKALIDILAEEALLTGEVLSPYLQRRSKWN